MIAIFLVSTQNVKGPKKVIIVELPNMKKRRGKKIRILNKVAKINKFFVLN